MKNSFYLEDCPNDDVLAFNDDTYKVGKFRKAVTQALKSEKIGDQVNYLLANQYGVKAYANWNKCNVLWFGEGINCEILKLGSSGWKKGKLKIKVTLEFCPDEPEVETVPNNSEDIQAGSPLDDIRQAMTEENQQKQL